jgi:hypothetical protein
MVPDYKITLGAAMLLLEEARPIKVSVCANVWFAVSRTPLTISVSCTPKQQSQILKINFPP